MARSIIARVKKSPETDSGFTLSRFEEALERGHLLLQRESGERTKTSFAPSNIGYRGGPGICQRYWHYAFSGTHFDESVDSVSIAMMSNGRVSHERIQEAMKKAGIVVEIEKEMLYEDPPIKGYADAILEIDGETVVCEIKTCSAQAFQYRLSTGKPAIYHLYQILIYMMIEGVDKGVLLYEDRDSLRVCPILVRKTDQSDKILNDALDWMRAVYSDWKDGKSLTTRIGKTKRSPICKNCPVFDTCWSPFEPVGDRESLPFPEVKL